MDIHAERLPDRPAYVLRAYEPGANRETEAPYLAVATAYWADETTLAVVGMLIRRRLGPRELQQLLEATWARARELGARRVVMHRAHGRRMPGGVPVGDGDWVVDLSGA